MADDTVILNADEDQENVKEARANGTVTPSALLEYGGNNTSGPTTERNFTEADTDGVSRSHVAVEQSYAGRGISDDYSSGDALRYMTLRPGDEVQLFVFDGANAGGAGTDLSANANISAGDRLVAYSGSGDTGCVRAFVSGTDPEGAVIGRATENVDNSGGSSRARISVEAV